MPHVDQATIDDIRAHTDMVMLVGQTVALKKRGNIFWGLCPWHKEKTASFKVDNERHIAHCFSCARTEDAFEWVQQTRHCSFPEAVEFLSNGKFKANGANGANGAAHHMVDAAPAKQPPKPMAIMPVPDDAPGCQFLSPSLGEPTGTWTYRDATGALLGHVARYDIEGRKVFQPYVYTSKGWKNQGFPDPRPIYGLDRLAARPDAPVLVVEGEKSAVAAQALLPEYVCVTWHGGASAVKKTDWSPLKGRSIVCWPDADDAGATAMKHLVKLIGGGRIIEPPAGVEKGWDVADALAEGWDTARVSALLAPPHEPEPVEARGPMPADLPTLEPGEPQEPPVFDPADRAGSWPFSLLGHRNGTYHYLPNAGGTVISLGGASHSKNALMMIAPLHFWETAFSAFDKKSYDAAANALMTEQHRRGIYDHTRLRGRGAWWDEGRVVVHLGDRLIVNGEITPIKEFKTDFLYEVAPKIRFVNAKPLANEDAHRLIELCKLLSWERPLSAYLLAGWIALAPVCGALNWRSNILLTGQSGAGKSWIYQNIICKTVGPSGYALAANVSEPGIRRTLGSDAMPVMIDELEARDFMAAQRIEAIMGLMRYSSSETDAMIVKGANSGAGVEFFKIRSMFCTVAIGSQITDYADATRTSVLSLKAVHGLAGEMKFHAIEDAQRALLTERWIDSLRTRIVGLIPIIRHNVEVFSLAGARVLGTRRLGDQLGTLLAGAYALTSREKITPEKAAAWLEQQDWSEEQEIVLDTDGPSCFARIMEHQVMCEVRQGGGHVKRAIGELMAMVAKKSGDEAVSYDTAIATAKRHGVLFVEPNHVAISNTHSEIAKILYDSPWSANWHRRLKTIRGAVGSENSISFGKGAVARAVCVPWEREADIPS